MGGVGGGERGVRVERGTAGAETPQLKWSRGIEKAGICFKRSLAMDCPPKLKPGLTRWVWSVGGAWGAGIAEGETR